MANPFRRLANRYQQTVSDFISPALRGIDAGGMSPNERAGLMWSESAPEVIAQTVEASGQGKASWEQMRAQAEAQVRKVKANAGKTTEELRPEIAAVQKQLERLNKQTTATGVGSGPLNSSDDNLMLRALLSDPNDAQMTALLNDQQFSKAVGISSQELLETRQQLNDAASLAGRIQNQGPTGLAAGWDIKQNPDVNAMTLLANARANPSNANLNAALDSIRSPQVTRTADPYRWETSAKIDIPSDPWEEKRVLPKEYKNPLTGERMDRGEEILPPGEQGLITENLNSFLNRAYGVTSDTQKAVPGKVNTDFSFVTDLDGDLPGAQAWAELNQLRAATERAEALGATAADRAGAMTTNQKLERLRGMQSRQGSKVGERGIDYEVQKAAKDLFDLEGRQMSDAEKSRLMDDINSRRPGVLDDALDLIARLPKTENLDGGKVTAQVFRAADRAGVGVGSRKQTSGNKQFKTPRAQGLHDFATSPKTGLTVVGLGGLTAAAALAAGIRDAEGYEYNYTREDGEPFSNSVRDEALYRMRMADPTVLAGAIQNAQQY